MYGEILADLSAGNLALTANLRLSALLRKEYDQFHYLQKKQLWPSANVLPIHTWLIKLWQEIDCEKLLLSDFQENHLWRKIINDDQEQLPLIHLSNTAELVAQAWSLLHQWQIDITDLYESDNQDVQFFCRWSQQFQDICRQKQFISQVELAGALLQKIPIIKIKIPKIIYLVGFDELTPAIENLIHALQQDLTKETLIKFYQAKPLQGEIHQIKRTDSTDEITSMANWAKAIYLKNPNNKIACVVPDLNHRRNQVHSIFTQIFCLENLLPGIDHSVPPFNISAGSSLSQFPLIAHALAALTLCWGSIKLETLAELLHSPYFCLHAEDMHFAALVDLEIRDYQQQFLAHSELLSIFNKFTTFFPKNTWSTRWHTLKEFVATVPASQPIRSWSKTFSSLLKISGWPGSRTLNSLEYQLVSRWQQLYDEFNKLTWFESELTVTHAVDLFKSLVNQTIFQPQSQDVSIQVLGVLETAGHQFDQMWIMGLHDEAWPPAAKPNPFIPYSLQITKQIPHASAERELSYSQGILQRLLGSADRIILSSPQQEGDKKLQTSRLICQQPFITQENLGTHSSIDYRLLQKQSQKIELLQDDQAPIVQPNEKIRGGSRIFKLQASCPFRAFATLRLRAEPLTDVEMGISATERGILAHRVLEKLWKELKDQKTLKALTEVELTELIEKYIVEICEDTFAITENVLDDLFFKLEKKRLYALIYEWLQFEKQRPPFSVTAQERAKTVKIGQLKLNIQIDRIDRLTDGSELIIDYKTGNCSLSDWFGERMREPQLPLYCVYGSGKINHNYAGISFAVLQPGKTQLKGLISEKYPYASYPIVGIKPDTISWQQRTVVWRETLTMLANDFTQGKAVVDPVDTVACQYCDLQPLCRVTE